MYTHVQTQYGSRDNIFLRPKTEVTFGVMIDPSVVIEQLSLLIAYFPLVSPRVHV